MIVMENISWKGTGEKTVLHDLELTVEKGECFGLVGIEGAGKTTVFRILTGLLVPNTGQVVMDGLDVFQNRETVRRQIGYVPAVFGSYGEMTTSEYLEYYAGLYGISQEEANRRGRVLLEENGLGGFEKECVEHLTVCQKRQLSLARCMVHQPSVLLLDGFLEGIDASAQKLLTQRLMQIRQQEMTILIGARAWETVASLEAVFGILQDGTIRMRGTLQEIQEQQNRANPLEIILETKREEAVRVLKRQNAVTDITIDGNKIYAGFVGTPQEQTQILQEMIQCGVGVRSYRRKEGV